MGEAAKQGAGLHDANNCMCADLTKRFPSPLIMIFKDRVIFLHTSSRTIYHEKVLLCVCILCCGFLGLGDVQVSSIGISVRGISCTEHQWNL